MIELEYSGVNTSETATRHIDVYLIQESTDTNITLGTELNPAYSYSWRVPYELHDKPADGYRASLPVFAAPVLIPCACLQSCRSSRLKSMRRTTTSTISTRHHLSLLLLVRIFTSMPGQCADALWRRHHFDDASYGPRHLSGL